MAGRPRVEPEQQRARILAAALALVEKSGWQAVTTRAVAKKIGYASPILYEHFRNLDALLRELQESGYVQLAQVMREAAHAAPPQRRLLAVCRRFLRFADENKGLYQVMTELGGVSHGRRDPPRAGQLVFQEALLALRDWATHAGVVIPAIEQAVVVIWVTLHGIAALHLAGLAPGVDPEPLITRALADLEKGWSAR